MVLNSVVSALKNMDLIKNSTKLVEKEEETVQKGLKMEIEDTETVNINNST